MADSNKSLESVVTVPERLQRRERLLEKDALELLLCVARQVAALHASGSIHRAVAVASIQFSQSDQPRLLPPPPSVEFGGLLADSDTCPPELQIQSSITLSPSIDEAKLTLARQGISMAPQRVDVYQLAALLCRFLTGANVDSYLQSAKCKRLVPSRWQAVIDAGLGFDPALRHQTVGELTHSLESSSRDATKDADTDPQISANDRDTDSLIGPISTAAISGGRTDVEPGTEAVLPFQRLGHYEIVERIGHGGMGDVYKGYERALDRVVAIKVLPAEFARQADFVARFRAEAAAVASLTHPNVIQIHFIGEDQGHHFFAMQFVDGETLGDRIHRRRLDVNEAMSVLEQVLAGLSAAHRRGIVHRDIKPANVLLDRVNHRALVADFGLVKSLGGGEKKTATGIIMGTVDYISPEQARGHNVDARSDLYSVGVLAYQLLSGRLPFEADSAMAMIFQHVYEQPKPLSAIVSGLPKSLCAIVDTLMAKLPEQRYQTADEALADFAKIRAARSGRKVTREVDVGGSKTAIIQAPQFDIPLLPDELEQFASLGWWQRTRQQLVDRLRRHQPALIKRLQNTQQQVDGALHEYEDRQNGLQELVSEAEDILHELQRNKEGYQEAATAAASRASEAADEHESNQALQEQSACVRCADELSAPIAEQQSQLESMQLKLAQVRATLDKLRNQRDLLNARLKMAQVRTALAAEWPKRRATQYAIRAAIVIGFGTALTIAAIMFWPKSVPTIPSVPATSLDIQMGPAGERIIPTTGECRSMGIARTRPPNNEFMFAMGNVDGSVNVFNVITGGRFMRPMRLSSHLQPINDIAYSPDGKVFATACEDGVIDIWDNRSNSKSQEWRRFESQGTPVTRILFSPDGTQLLAAGRNGSLRLWDVAREQPIHTGPDFGWIEAMDWSRDGRHVLLGLRLDGAHSMKLVNLYDEGDQITFDTNKRRTDEVSFSRFEDQAIALRSQSIHVYDMGTKEIVKKFGDGIRTAAFSPASNRAWTALEDRSLVLWDIRSGTALETYSGHAESIVSVAISIDGSQAYSVSRDGSTRIWDLPPTPPPANQLKELACGGRISFVAFSPDGFSALASAQGDVTLWELNTFTVVRKFGIQADVSSMAFAADGMSIIYGGDRAGSKLGLVGIRELNNPIARDRRQLEGLEGHVSSIALSWDQRHAVAGGSDGSVRVWQTDTGQEVGRLDVGEPIHAVEFTKQADAILIGSDGNNARLWKWESSKEVTQLAGHTYRILDVAISADGVRAATASADRTVRVWELATGQLLATLTGHSGAVNSVALSEHGLIAFTGSGDSTVRMWDVAMAKELERFEGHTGNVRSVALSRDGTRLLSGGDDGMLRIWKVPLTVQ